MRTTDYELRPSHKVALAYGNLTEWKEESVALDYGMIIICRCGTAAVHVNFNVYVLRENSVLSLFPNDVVMTDNVSADFRVEYLRYDASVLREASLQLEQTVYSQLRLDRCRGDSHVACDIINAMFTLLRIYFVQEECQCLEQLVLLQLKAFFLGFHDYMSRFPEEKPEEPGSRRTRELFNRFMYLLENKSRESRDVSYYASLMHITPKYLSTIVQRVTGHKVKTIIDHYVVLQLKLTLKNSTRTAKEIAWEYHFSDLSFFCRYFKQHTGMTPQEFRRKVTER